MTIETRPEPKNSQRSIFASYSESFYRNDIQGIRAISALLIMIYHIWLSRVSGGVDVFFVISGFLIATTLLRGLASTGRVHPTRFWSGIFKRVFPSAYTVLFVTLALTLVFVPAPLWKYGVNEFTASAAQIENLELIRMGADYLDREAPPSQFQQFWALSIQMQFYLVLPFIFMLLAFIALRRESVKPLVWGISAVAVASFTFSVYLTHVQPNEAYFHPFARFWEFLAGALVALVYPKLSTLGKLSSPLLWNIFTIAAVAVLATLGLTLGAVAPFPGWVALIPVLCAVTLITAGRASVEPTVATKALSNKTLVYFGSFSFTIYLWHWPVLVFAHHLLGTTQLNFLQGLLVIGIAIVLAVLTKRFIEDPLNQRRIKRPVRRLVIQLGFVLVVVALGLVLRQGIVYMAAAQTGNVDHVDLPMALTIQGDVEIPLEAFVTIDLNRPTGIDCLTRDCSGGDPNAEKLIVMAGASHSAQWYDIVDELGKQEGFRVITRLGQEDLSAIVSETNPDVLMMNSTKTFNSGSGAVEEVYLDDTEQWEEISAGGVQIIALRDNPRFGFYQNSCVWKHQNNADECAIEQSEVLLSVDPARAFDAAHENFHSIDLTDHFCARGVCPAVHDGVLMYYDKHHISKSYSNYIEDDVIRELVNHVPEVFAQR